MCFEALLRIKLIIMHRWAKKMDLPGNNHLTFHRQNVAFSIVCEV